MSSRESTSSSGDASTTSNGESFSSFESSVQDQLDLWTGIIPKEDDASFRSLIERPRPANQPFKPKDQHCGIWENAPSKECHASFGDQGTTASVSCNGDIIQITQFLGAGQSGLFSLDHELTKEPCQIATRAADLNALGIGIGNKTFGCHPEWRYLPDETPKMKWVNWRWPRYEWEISEHDLSASISYQWLVKNKTVFQQIVVKNTGTSSIDNILFSSDLSMLIRDLDYIGKPSYNKGNSKSYVRGLGPNDYSWITANLISSEEPDTSQDDGKRGDQATGASGCGHEHGQGHSPDEAERPPSDDNFWGTRRISDTWSTKKTHAVVSIMSVFVNGTAQKMEKGLRRSEWNRTLGPSGSNSSVLEITVAYKLIAVPKEKVHWKNFLIPAAAADVTAMLTEETEKLWGHSFTDVCNCNPSLCDIGISTKCRHERDVGATTDIVEETSQKPCAIDSIEYLTWRHTEHILSACTIPLLVPPIQREGEEPSNMQAQEIAMESTDVLDTPQCEELGFEVPLALTCGDISGHRICTSASFFAFKFLIGMLERLSSVEQTPYIESLQGRISAACRGHIRWLEWVRKPWCKLEDTESLLSSGCFAGNYWVSGQIIPKGSESWQPGDAITDTPFQVLKVTTYVKWLRTAHKIQSLEDERLKVCVELLRDVWAYWIHELDDLDKRKASAWRHASEDGLSTYRLDDHVWLWSGLVELHSLEFWSLTEAGIKIGRACPERWISHINSLSPTAELDRETYSWMAASKGVRNREPFAEFALKARRLLPEAVQQAVIQRFTVENDVSQERMLAVTRSTRETRFFFHTRDTALFYAHELKFFDFDASSREFWERTLKSQIYHREALHDSRNSPLRLALGAVAGLRGFSIDKRSSVQLLKESVEALIQASTHNAFIPGKIDAFGRSPSTFSEDRDRDYYYHVGFEALYILSEYGKDIDLAFRVVRNEQTNSHLLAGTQDENVSRQMQPESTDAFLNETMAQPKEPHLTDYPQESAYIRRALAKILRVDGGFDTKRTSLAMKKSMPFNSMIDASSITNLEEEWLYNYPDFLLVKDIDLDHELELLVDKDHNEYKSVNGSFSVIDLALLGLRPPQKFSIQGESFEGWFNDGFVANLPKKKSRRQRRGKRDIGASLDHLPRHNPNRALWDTIGKARSASTAKKRFLWLPANSDPQTALLCWLASAKADRPALAFFFDRHAEYENYLWDDTNMVLNAWQTELHLCFWFLSHKGRPFHKGLPRSAVAAWPRDTTKEFRRASIGFRFDGDFFDRYWTCHYIQNVPGSYGSLFGASTDLASKFENEKEFWQRKVLELQLLQHILGLILTESNKILKGIETELGLQKGILVFSVLTTEVYLYEGLLERAEEDITSSLNILSKWATREHDRGQEKPRWTWNDEKQYRRHINKLSNQIERQRWDLESSRDKMSRLRDTLTKRLEAKRGQNIRNFTYVTVVFLPLGFAASFYSMNGPPSNDLIASLAKFSAATFALTAILLLSASAFITMAARGLMAFRSGLDTVQPAIFSPYNVTFVADAVISVTIVLTQYPEAIRKQSILFQGSMIDNVLEGTEGLPQVYLKNDWMSSPWFWPAYLFVELPTKTVSSAWSALETGNLSFEAIWSVFLGMVVLPVYGISQAVLFSLNNIALLIKIQVLLYHLVKKRLAKGHRKPKNQVSEDRDSDAQVQPPHSPQSVDTVTDENGDAERRATRSGVFPDHFLELLPAAEPLDSLQKLEGWLKRRL